MNYFASSCSPYSASSSASSTPSSCKPSPYSYCEEEFFPPNVSITPETSTKPNIDLKRVGQEMNTLNVHKYGSYKDFVEHAVHKQENGEMFRKKEKLEVEKKTSILWKLLNQVDSVDELAYTVSRGNTLAPLNPEDIDRFEQNISSPSGPLPTDNLRIDLSKEVRYFADFGQQSGLF